MSSFPVCAIHYHPDAYRADRVGVKGRHSAGAGFLGGLFRHGRAPHHACLTGNDQFAAQFSEMAAAADPLKREAKRHKTQQGIEQIAECLMIAGPVFDDFIWTRRAANQRAYSLCGITHTLSSDRIIRPISQYLLQPLQPWDAVVCTSRVAREVITRTMENYADYLGRLTGASFKTALKLPVIPLGVDSSRYEADPAARARLRQEIGAADGDFVILFLGRFTFHAKAHPTPMILAAERAAQRLPDRKVHLVFAGQAPNESVLSLYQKAAEMFSVKAAVHFVDGRDNEMVHAAWQGADVFLSLSDNIQETFGLTPIEAMAAGLPSVVSDWDGYKDTIVDGETGFRVSTVTPGAGHGVELAYRYQTGRDDYDRYVGRACMSTSCDLTETADRLVQLAEDAELRRRMGMAGRKRAREHYDWSVVVKAYEELWMELRELRRSADEVAPRKRDESVDPFYPDPFAIFAPHPTVVLGQGTKAEIDSTEGAAGIDELFRHNFSTFSAEMMLQGEALRSLIAKLEQGGPVPLPEIESWFEPALRTRLHRTLPWLSKFGLIKLSDA